MRRIHAWVLPVIAALALASQASGQAAQPAQLTPDQARLIEVSDRLSDEAERQYMVRQRMDVAVASFLQIIEDLRSNDLFRQAKGPEMDRIVQVLRLLAGKHVPGAAAYLEEARKRLEALKPNLEGAGKEIDIILAELERLLKQAAGQQADDLLRELEIIIQDEKKNHQETKEWGVQLLQNPEQAEQPRQAISESQDRIAKRTDRFMDRLREARDAEQEAPRRLSMEKAHQVLDQAKVGKLLAGAARDISEKKPVTATRQQEDAIKALEEAARFLRQDDLASQLEQMKELREKLEEILKEQTELRQDTEKPTPEKFPREKNDLQVRQRNTEKKLTEATTPLPQPTSPDLKTHVDTAKKEMKQAETKIAATEQQPAAESQKKAEKALQDALKTLDQDIAAAQQNWDQQNAPPSLADLAQKALELAQKQRTLMKQTGQTQPQNLPQHQPPQNGLRQEAQALNQQMPMQQFQEAASQMQQASQQLGQREQQPAMQHQEKAAQALESAAAALQQAQTAMNLAAQQQQLMQQTAQTAPQALPQLAPPQQALQQQTQAAQFQQAAQAMQQAAQSLQQSQGQQAQQSQQAAINALMGQAAQALGMQPGTMPGTMPAPALVAMPVPTTDPDEQGLRDFGHPKPAEGKTAPGDARWNPLGARERDALYQKFARELPPEYRELLGDYYEALSKEPTRPAARPAPAAGTAPAGGGSNP